MSFYIEFYKGKGPDDKGRLLTDLLNQPDYILEKSHNYIQRLFPLTEKSNADPSAPLLDADDILAFRENPIIKEYIELAFIRILKFYGLELTSHGQIKKAENFAERSKVWLTTRNHNYLRITRILKFLNLVGSENAAHKFWNILREIYLNGFKFQIGSTTYNFWKEASGEIND